MQYPRLSGDQGPGDWRLETEDDKVVFIVFGLDYTEMNSRFCVLQPPGAQTELRLTQNMTALTVGVSVLGDIERIEAECEVSGVTETKFFVKISKTWTWQNLELSQL